MRILINSTYLTTILATAPDVAPLFDDTGSFVLCSPTAVPPVYSVNIEPVANYKSATQFFADVAAGTLRREFLWALYDPESWSNTPAEESADPVQYMQRFGQFAHTLGLRTIMAPARDLGNTDQVDPIQQGETLDAWYLRTGMPIRAARYADVYSIQSQADTVPASTFGSFVASAAGDAKTLSGNPYAARLCGLSTKYGTAAQMLAAWQSVSVGGFWLNIPDGDYTKAITFLRSLP